jgi:hypothetical protein
MNHLTRLITRAAAASALLAASLAAQATVEAGHWGYGSLFNGINPLSLDQAPSGNPSYGVQTTYNAQTGIMTFGVHSAAWPADLFLVTPGQVIGRDNWASLAGQMQPIVTDPTAPTGPNSFLQVGKDFYLGAATIAFADPEFNWATLNTTRTSFGWAHFQAQADGTLKLLDSAMAFREPGIVVGTLQAVPEPGTWALMGLGLVGVAAVSRRRPR